MRQIGALLLGFVVVGSAAHAAGGPQVRVHVDSRGPHYVGQSIRIDVQVLVPNFFMSAPQFPTFEVSDAVVTFPDEDATHLTETIDGETYVGIQRSYLIVAQQAGEFVLPPARITFKYAAVPGQPPADGAVTLPPFKLQVQLPEGAQAGAPVARVTIHQHLDHDLDGLKVGDALTRTVEVFAAHTQAMMIPPPEFEAPAGVRVYPKDPSLTDVTTDRGEFVGGRRIDHATYVFEKAGDYVLPAIEVPWFDEARRKQQVAHASEIRLTIAPNLQAQPLIAPEAPLPVEADVPPPKRFDWRRWMPLVAGIGAVAFLLSGLMHRYAARVLKWRRERRDARAQSENAYFARAIRACHADAPAEAYQAVGRWVRRIGADSVASFCASTGKTALSKEVAALGRLLYAKDSAATRWYGGSLAGALQEARAKWRSEHRPESHERYGLPLLNPR